MEFHAGQGSEKSLELPEVTKEELDEGFEVLLRSFEDHGKIPEEDIGLFKMMFTAGALAYRLMILEKLARGGCE